MANRRRTDTEGKYKKRVEEDETYKDIAGLFPGIGTAITVSDIEDELSKEDPSYLKVGILGASEALGLVPGVGSAAKTLVRKGVQKLDDVVDIKQLTKDADTDAIDNLGLTEDSLEAWKAENYAKDKYRIAPIRKLQEAAVALREGNITSAEFRELSDAYQPIVPIDEMPKFPTKEDVVQALYATDKRKVSKGIVGVNKTIPDGAPISARLDIPAYNDTDTWIVSLHDGTEKSGKTVAYAQTAVLNDVNFTTNPLAASSIASGKGKTTIARMNGSYLNAEPEEVYNVAKQILEANPEDWTQVGMNPYRASYFYDKADGMPVTSADQVIQVGPLVFAKNAKKTTPDDEMFEFTNKVTGVTANFSEGGMAIEEQMSMNFGDVPDNTIGIDPVSGNEIPLGATAENVRDDIPSNLSEGEIVVPADVVNFHGIKLFEDLRAEAKMGYAQMNADGRIGGEPVPTSDNELGLELADLEIMEVPDEPQQMADGGLSNEKPVFKNRAEAIIYYLTNLFDYEDDDDEPEKPKNKPKIDFGFGGNLMERAARKYDFDEGGLGINPPRGVNPPRVVDEGKVGSILPEGFDPAVDRVGTGTGTGGGVTEMREYQNAEGHTIMIPFIDGVPQEVIPEGYFPTGAPPVSIAPSSGGGSGTSTQGGGSSNDGDKEPTEPFIYEELTIDELTEEVENLRNSPKFAGTTLFTGIIALAQARHKDKTIKEIERRLESTDLAIYEREYLQNLLEVAKAPAKKGMLTKLLDKVTGAEPEEEPDLPELDKPKFDDPEKYNQLYLFEPGTVLNADEIAEKLDAYTPEATRTTPSVKNPFTGSSYDEVVQQRKDDEPSVSSSFGPDIMKKVEEIDAIAKEKALGKPAYTNPALDPYAENRRDDDDDEPTFAPTPTPPSNTGGYDPVGGGSVDDPGRRTGGGGRNKGGLMKGKKKKATKKKTKKSK